MTPPAATVTPRARPSAGKGSGHRRAITRRSPAPRIPRRVSGPAKRRAPAARPLGARIASRILALPDHGVVDRLLRGRSWIAVIGTLLIGLVAMQVSMLKINAGIGRAVERSADLERSNGELRATVSRLSSGERIQERAGRLGLVMPAAGAIHYVHAQPRRDARGASSALTAGRFDADAVAQAGVAPVTPQPELATTTAQPPAVDPNTQGTAEVPTEAPAPAPVAVATPDGTTP
jgi:hypothetical protein